MDLLGLENRKYSIKRTAYCKPVLFSFFFFLLPFICFSQDSIPAAKDLSEEKELKFQQYFFKALTQKSIGNYQKAIENLESCNQILNNNSTVFFEFSKNYFLLNETLIAKEYIERALAKDANNIWMQKHLVKILIKQRNYKEAIKVQNRLILSNPKERIFLVRIYLYDRDYKKALSLLNTLEEQNSLTPNLKKLQENLITRKGDKVKEIKLDDVSALKIKFKSDKSYKILKEILDKSVNINNDLLLYGKEGVSLFPAQPYVYLMYAKALNNQKKFKKALNNLKNGIDFVIEDEMEMEFYKEMAAAYRGLGNYKEEKKYNLKAKKIKS